MPRFLKRLSILLGLLIVASLGWGVHQRNEERLRSKLEERLTTIQLDTLEWKDLTCEQCAEQFSKLLVAHGVPKRLAAVRVIRDSAPKPDRVRLTRTTGADGSETIVETIEPTHSIPPKTATFRVTGAPPDEGRDPSAVRLTAPIDLKFLANYITVTFDCQWEFAGGAFRIGPRDRTFVSRKYPFSTEIAARHAIQPGPDGRYDMRPMLETNGITLHRGSVCEYDPGTGMLTVKLTEDSMAILESMVGGVTYEPTAWERIKDQLRNWIPGI